MKPGFLHALLKKTKFCYVPKHFSRNYAEISPQKQEKPPEYIELCKELTGTEQGFKFLQSVTVLNDFLSPEEEQSLHEEVEPYMNRLKYQFDHWDDAIHGYRETERLNWTESNSKVLDRVRAVAFLPSAGQLKQVHILDLDEKGWIKPHIDAVRFCGDTVAGLSLLTDSVMRFVHEKEKNLYADVLLKQRSLYIMKGVARYDYTHELLKNELSKFKGTKIDKKRRISIICRNEPDSKDIQ